MVDFTLPYLDMSNINFRTVICNFYPTLLGQNTFINIAIDAQRKSSGVDKECRLRTLVIHYLANSLLSSVSAVVHIFSCYCK